MTDHSSTLLSHNDQNNTSINNNVSDTLVSEQLTFQNQTKDSRAFSRVDDSTEKVQGGFQLKKSNTLKKYSVHTFSQQKHSPLSVKAASVQSGYCMHCNHQNIEGMNFCEKCGNLLDISGVSQSQSNYSKINVGNSIGGNPLIKGNIRSES